MKLKTFFKISIVLKVKVKAFLCKVLFADELWKTFWQITPPSHPQRSCIRVGRNTDWKCHADQCPRPISDIGTSGNKCNDEQKAALDVGKICFCVQIDGKQMRMVVDALTSTDNVIALPLMNNHRAPAGMTRQARADSFRKVPAIRGHLP
ncbi:Large ribosomal subunit protein [Trichinella spiralis]|uniref:Large ribosomal subunit protein n=1 Tax=Trichinella spiralis TaxID=6334 RepID=A0ABR3KUN3_TRISP